jgi:hypothetical protein
VIYFAKDMDLDDPVDVEAAYHELEHVVQYARHGGVEPFLAEYILKTGGRILRGGNSIDMHDNIDLEHDAIAKARQVATAVTNGSPASNQPSTPTFNIPTAPPSMTVGNICRTQWISCYLPSFGLVGQTCYCGSPNGPLNGAVSQN